MKQTYRLSNFRTFVRFGLYLLLCLSACTNEAPKKSELTPPQTATSELTSQPIPVQAVEHSSLKSDTSSNGTKAKSADPEYNFSSSNVYSVKLPEELAEISGLTCSPDGRLFTHDDEVGKIYELDPNEGNIVKYWKLGPKTVKEDFEGIAFCRGIFYLTNSSGKIYRFSEGAQGENVTYTTFDSGLSDKNNVEGMCYDAASNSLLLACKDDPGNGIENSRAIYRVDLPLGSADTKLYLSLALADLTHLNSNSEFRPSGIEIHPETGSLYVIAARGNSIAVLRSDGGIKSQSELPKELHTQPEGITITNKGTVYISNEGAGGRATLYRFEPGSTDLSR